LPDPPDELSRISKAEQSIRDRVNDPRLRYRLTRNHKLWNQVVSSLDAIGDTGYAFAAYLSRSPEDTGSGYLFLYGVLQALVIQQDAVRHLSEALGTVGDFDDPRLREARRVRIEAAGHPTRKDRPKGSLVTSHQVARVTIGQHGFMMLTSDETGGIHTEQVDLVRVIGDQRTAIAEMLEALDAEIARSDREVRIAHKDERLTALFHPSLGYCFEKLHDGIFNAHPLGAPSLDQIKELITAFAAALEKRGLATDAYPGIHAWYDEIGQPIAELEAFFEHRSQLHPQILSIIASHVKDQVALLQKMAGEIDEDWAVDDEPA
jgi:hypothetical protein